MLTTHTTERAAREHAAEQIKQGYPVARITSASCLAYPQAKFFAETVDDSRALIALGQGDTVVYAGKYHETADDLRELLQQPKASRPDPWDPLTSLMRVARIRVERARQCQGLTQSV